MSHPETIDAPRDRATSRADSRDGAEVAKFAAMAAEWWDSDGPMAPLHALNPARLGYLRDHVCGHFGRDERSVSPLKGLTVLDAGCGAGLLSEPLARMGGQVTGIDAAADVIAAAKSHAKGVGLDIDYRVTTIEGLADAGAQFDLVVSMEVVEHVADPAAFLADCARVTQSGGPGPGGALVLSTLNRTKRSFGRAIVGAEYLLRLVPRGTHDWRKFVRPSEMRRGLAQGGAQLVDVTGLVPGSSLDDWRTDSRDVSVNYLAFAVKPSL